MCLGASSQRGKEGLLKAGKADAKDTSVIPMVSVEDVSRKGSTGRTQATAPSKAWPEVEEMSRKAEKMAREVGGNPESLGQGRKVL